VSPPRTWTVAEARAALPRVRELLLVLQRAATLATKVRSNGHAALHASEPESTQVSGDGGTEEPEELDASPASGALGGAGTPIGAGGIQPILDGLEELGIVLRDPARGLIDFPSVHLGRQVQLCWQLGEDDIGWWHFPEDGFAGRHPLPLPDSW
jgi:hypothetical protein